MTQNCRSGRLRRRKDRCCNVTFWPRGGAPETKCTKYLASGCTNREQCRFLGFNEQKKSFQTAVRSTTRNVLEHLKTLRSYEETSHTHSPTHRVTSAARRKARSVSARFSAIPLIVKNVSTSFPATSFLSNSTSLLIKSLRVRTQSPVLRTCSAALWNHLQSDLQTLFNLYEDASKTLPVSEENLFSCAFLCGSVRSYGTNKEKSPSGPGQSASHSLPPHCSTVLAASLTELTVGTTLTRRTACQVRNFFVVLVIILS